ncbi:MAG: energy-coupling factor transporter transmembrane protein EcfT [Methanoregulaceae archaeon]|nr:energy-coupling factor transporter transmembrane protein EcfT [Methanoregulaceae archaeon]
MSQAIISPHIPDLDLITVYAQRQDTWFSGVSPWTKFAGLFLIVLLVTLTKNLLVCISLYVVVLLVYAASDLPVRKLFSWYLIPVLFVLSLVGIMAWTEPGVPLFTLDLGIFPLTLTDAGAMLVVTLLLKALISVTYSLFFLMTTRYQYFSAMISRIFPSPLDQIFLMAYRFLFLTLSMIGAMMKAIRSRGGGIVRSLRVQGRIFAEVFALVFIRSFDRAERVSRAMISRGYQGKLEAATDIPRPGLSGYGTIAVSLMAIVLIASFVPDQWGLVW